MMRFHNILSISLAAILAASPAVAQKKALDHDSFDSWKKVTNHSLSNDGAWAAFSINPQEGDGTLTFRSTRDSREVIIPRGSNPVFTADSRWAVAKIKPFFQDTRKAKIDKKKDFDMPQDSIAIIDLMTLAVTKMPGAVSFKVPEKGGEWIAYATCDTTLTKEMDLKEKDAGLPLALRNLRTGESRAIPYVKDYVFSEDGKKLALTIAPSKKDSVRTKGVSLVNFTDATYTLIDREKKHYGSPVFSTDGMRLAFTASNDSNETGTQRYRLFLADLSRKIEQPQEINVTQLIGRGPNLQRPHAADPEVQEKLLKEWGEQQRKNQGHELFPNQYSKPLFSHDGRRLVIGVAPEVAPDDTTLVSFERPELDIWRWDAPMTPPQEKHNLGRMKEKIFPVVVDLATLDNTLIDSEPLATVVAPDRWDADWALVQDPTAYAVQQQWDYFAPEDVYIVNVNTGQRKQVANTYTGTAELSPCGKFVFWWKDGDWYAYEISSGETRNLTSSLPYPAWDEDIDMPMVRQACGEAGWSADDKAFLIYDRHDIWQLDPTGTNAPVCLTKGYGREKNLQIRYINTVAERRYLSPGDLMTLTLFDYADKRRGLASMKYGVPSALQNIALGEYSDTQVRQAKDAPSFSFVQANFSVMPDIWLAPKGDFPKAYKMSDSNPQQKDYRWGTAQLVEWRAYDGTPSQGVLYVPDDLDPNEKYPMLCVFYETGSEDLYTHYNMEPSWSWVNYPFYVSRGYVIFVPDIHYKAGIPGECAWNFVCSGAEAMCDRYPFIDRERIGIDGQSWGGYQTAYLVTRTDMFACAGSGAPVANMTSAFGGIRWESGDSRQGQYEMGQSRIGRNLWDATEMYVANSPVFHANRVHTPLLIMHNDADGAVPWYQGIEMFMALRRLQKPVWMLQYNGEAHNLKERRNRKDITVRLQQFFDHYLKGDPMPEWMKDGVPMTRKGQELGY